MIGRRGAVVSIAGGLAIAPLRAPAQQPATLRRIGVLGIDRPSAQALASSPFTLELRRLGYVEGRNLVIEGRFSGAEVERLGALAAELAALKVDVIVTFSGTLGVVAAKKATATIPIVMVTSADPVGTGLIASLARPGGNITGNAIFGLELAVKRLQILAETVGKPTRIARLLHRSVRAVPRGDEFNATLADAAQALGAKFQLAEVETIDDLEPAFELMVRQHVDAVLVDNFFFPTNWDRVAAVAALSLRHRLPAIAEGRGFAEAGLLAAYGVDYPDLMRKAAGYVDKILKGVKPADLPVEQATKFEFVVNLKTARALGITIPRGLLARADEVIE